jgi:hypothetical protein
VDNIPVPAGFKNTKVDLNGGTGRKVYLCYRHDMPIRDIKVYSPYFNFQPTSTSTFQCVTFNLPKRYLQSKIP